MPRRSAGCEKCRQRKVRCDEAKPYCKRCHDYGVQCPGYRPPPEKDIHFVDQTRKIVRQAATASTAQVPLPPKNASRDRANRDTEFRWRHHFSGEIARLPGPTNVNNKHLHRVQLLSSFLDLYLPKRVERSVMSHFTYITALPNVDLSSPLLQISVDTLCLAELGSLYDDERCLQESRSRYVRALPMLANELGKPERQQLRKDHILAAISLLALCELFDAIARGRQGGKGWINHVQGAQTYLRHHYKEVMDSPFGWLLFHNIRHMSLCMSLVRRKASYLAEPSWLKLTKNDAKKDAYVGLYDLCIQAPGMLERADNLITSNNFDEDFFSVCRDVLNLRAEMDEWMQHHYLNKGGVKYKIVDLREMREFTKTNPNRLFMTVFDFPSVQICSQYQLFWITCLILDFTIANIYRVYKTMHQLPPLDVFTTRSRDDIWRDMYVAATNYCRCVPFSCEPETSSIGRIGTFLLRISSSFFSIAGFEDELEWCADVRRMLAGNPPLNQKLSSSNVQPPPASYPMVSGTADPSSVFSHINHPPNSHNPSSSSAPPSIQIQGEYPNTGYTPRSNPTSAAPTNTITSSLPILNRLPVSQILPATDPGFKRLPDTSELSARIGLARLAVENTHASSLHQEQQQQQQQPQGRSIPMQLSTISLRQDERHVNGASTLTDELSLPQTVEAIISGANFATHPSRESNSGEIGIDLMNDDDDYYYNNNDGGGSGNDLDQPSPPNLDGIVSGVRSRQGVNINCDEGFISTNDLERGLVGNLGLMGDLNMPEGVPRKGAVGGVCF